MIEGNDPQKKSLNSLVQKIRRLRRRLLSYGWGREQASTFILYEFLKLPEVQWEEPQCTASYYKIKEKYKVESGTAQLMLCLQEVVPNIESGQVLQYLHTVFQYSAINYGFELFESSSSSDSGQNPRISKRPRPHHQRITRARIRYKDFSPPTRKKIHLQEQKVEKIGEAEGIPRQQVRLVRRRRLVHSSESEEWQKKLKKGEQ